MTLNDLTSTINKYNILYENDIKTLTALELKKKELNEQKILLEESIALAKKCIEKGLELKEHIENVISSGLSEVLEDDYKWVLEPVYDKYGDGKGLKAKLSLNDGVYDEAYSGGEGDILNVCYRLAMLLLSGKTAKFIVFDECSAHLKIWLQHRLKAFIENVAEKTGVQILFSTHQEEPFGTVYKVSKKKIQGTRGISVVERINNVKDE